MRTCLAVALVAVFGTPPSGSAQEVLPGGQAAAGQGPVRQLSAEQAVALALENNLGLEIARVDPQLQDINLLSARTAWSPTVTTQLSSNSSVSPNQSFLDGGQGGSTSSDGFSSRVGYQQSLPWAGQYDVTWNSNRTVTNNTFTNFSPRLTSQLQLNYTQPLLRNFSIDGTRQQLQQGELQRDIADVSLREQIAVTSRTVRNAYWDLAYAVESLAVQQQSLELAEEQLRNTRARVEIGSSPPIDIVQDESEVASRREAVILAESQIETAQDGLRVLIFDPASPDFWTTRIETTELPEFQPATVNVDAAIRNALDRRTDLQNARTQLEISDIGIRYQRNQTLPDISASVNYNVAGVGGTQLQREGGGIFDPGGEVVTTESSRSFGTVLGDILKAEYPSWTASVNVSYPLGTSSAEAGLARARLERSRAQTQLRQQELQVSQQVRQVARQALTNEQRVQTTQVSRQLMERRLQAEEQKLDAGTSTNYLVTQAQRDLANARNSELQAVLDYYRSLVDLETVQEVPLR
jgi:HAE1 family hydrophobic/amphiphilic exporter-1